MKKIYLSLSFSLVIGLAFCQPVISNIEPEIGDEFLYTRTDNHLYWTPGDPGADMYWDYSGMIAQPLNDLNFTILAPSEGEDYESFPNATSVWHREPEIGSSKHIFRSFENNRMTTHGARIVVDVSDNYGHKYYNNAEAGIPFPLSYLDSGSDTYDGLYVGTFWAGIQTAFSGTTSYEVDGYGTVETQYGVFENVLRVKITQAEQILADTTNNFHNTIYTTRTQWYSNAYPVPVMMTTTSFEVEDEGTQWEDISDTSFNVAALAIYNGVNVTTGIESPGIENTFTVYPSPASDHIILNAEIQGTARLRIFSLDGKIVHESLVRSNASINVSDLSDGLYIADLVSQNKVYKPISFVVCKR